MLVDWKVQKGGRACSVNGRELTEGEAYFSALQDEGKTFARYDFSPEAWSEADKSYFFSFWRSRVPMAGEKKKKLVIDIEAFYMFFSQLAAEEETHKQVFRYLVALILTRKRVLRLLEVEKAPEGDTLLLFDNRAKQEIRVFCPEASREELHEAQEQLNQIFECQMGLDA